MEPADESDLMKATRQGTILEIWVDGKRYGHSSRDIWLPPEWAMIVAGSFCLVGCSILLWRRCGTSALLGTVLHWIRECFTRNELPSAFREHFHIESGKDAFEDEGEDMTHTPLSYVYE